MRRHKSMFRASGITTLTQSKRREGNHGPPSQESVIPLVLGALKTHLERHDKSYARAVKPA
jgi:hypothetical protein